MEKKMDFFDVMKKITDEVKDWAEERGLEWEQSRSVSGGYSIYITTASGKTIRCADHANKDTSRIDLNYKDYYIVTDVTDGAYVCELVEGYAEKIRARLDLLNK